MQKNKYSKRSSLKEDVGVSASDGVASNSAGGGSIAGIGVGKDGEPPGKTALQKKKKGLRAIVPMIKRVPPV